MGRNMFGPIRGPWGDEAWNGWWGDDPPYHTPVFVLTHHAREPLEMQGGTTFHFVTDGIESALERAFEAAGGQDVSLGGGAETVQQYLRAGLSTRWRSTSCPCFSAAARACSRTWTAARRVRVRRAGQLARRGALQLRPQERHVEPPGR